MIPQVDAIRVIRWIALVDVALYPGRYTVDEVRVSNDESVHYVEVSDCYADVR